MPQSFSRVVLHTVFSTKFRRPLIDGHIEPQLYAIITHLLRKKGCIRITIGGTPDHVHILHTLPRTERICDVIEEIKKVSSKWIKTKGSQYADFEWQIGYATHSADYRRLDRLKNYIRDQKMHHGIHDRGFIREYSALLRAYGHEFDPKYQFPVVE